VFPSGFFKLGEDEIHLLNRLFKNVIIISLSWIGIYKLALNNFVFQFDLLSTETTEAVIESQGLVSQLTGAMFTTLLTLPLFIVGLYHLRIIEREKQKTNLI
jgi:hypothetical protein